MIFKVDSNNTAKSLAEESLTKNFNSLKTEVESDLKSRLITSEIRISELVNQVFELQKKVRLFIFFYFIYYVFEPKEQKLLTTLIAYVDG